jgi:AcrR family transcriptional regulator
MATKRTSGRSDATAKGKGVRSSGQARRRDKEVVEAAVNVFYERGYTAASIQDIADSLGMLKGSLYYYIDTKEDLLFRVLEEVHDETDLLLDRIAGQSELTGLERLREYVEQVVLYNTTHVARMAVYYHDFDMLSAPRKQEILTRRHRHEEWVTGLIRAAQEAGDLSSDTDPRLLTNFLFGSMSWIYRWYRPKGGRGRVSVAEIADTCAEFVMRGLGAPERVAVSAADAG